MLKVWSNLVSDYRLYTEDLDWLLFTFEIRKADFDYGYCKKTE